jgi:hypothetical protein
MKLTRRAFAAIVASLPIAAIAGSREPTPNKLPPEAADAQRLYNYWRARAA